MESLNNGWVENVSIGEEGLERPQVWKICSFVVAV